MNDISLLIDSLVNAPVILYNLAASIPNQQLKQRRIKNKWTIHEHICHLAEAEGMIHNRFQEFKNNPAPVFDAYLPESNIKTDQLLDLDLNVQMQRFKRVRGLTVDLVKSFNQLIWDRQAIHEEYDDYGAYILLRHVVMHDYFHMYRIEELWLTKDKYLIQPVT